MATLRGEPVDRPAVSFYEIGGLPIDPSDPDPFNVYADPSWRPLLELAERETDLIRLRSAVRLHSHEAWDQTGSRPVAEVRRQLLKTQVFERDNCRWTRTELKAGGRRLTSLTKRDPAIDTLWTVEHLLKDRADVIAYLDLPDEFFEEHIDVAPLLAEEAAVGNRGIVMVDTEDPLCAAATLLDMQDYLLIAFTEPRLFHRLLEKLSRAIHARTERVAREFPGRLWRIYGPEYASEPYLPPRLFTEYVVRYVSPMIDNIHRHGGYVRVHCHGRIRNILDSIVAMGADAIDPIEPPPHGDVELSFVREQYGERLVLFGNIEVADIERMEPRQFDSLVCQTLEAGTHGKGRGFVLLPSASPAGRKIGSTTLNNYRTMVNRVTQWRL
jgi:uroporphyrinogen-III decarboxylase